MQVVMINYVDVKKPFSRLCNRDVEMKISFLPRVRIIQQERALHASLSVCCDRGSLEEEAPEPEGKVSFQLMSEG